MPNDYNLYDFQAEGVEWITSPRDNGYGFSAPPGVGLLGDEMGLGKTAQGLMALKKLFADLSKRRLIFLVPGATIIQWQKNYERWIENCEPDEFMTNISAIRGSDSIIPRHGSVIMSHTLFAKKEIIEKLIPHKWDGIVIDEVHKFGSRGTKRIKHLWTLINLNENHCGDIRIALSGTPTKNYAHEIYNVAHFLDPMRFRTFEDFARKYLTTDLKALWNPKQFHGDFRPYYIRRTVDQVQKSLPEIRRTKLYTEITNPFLKQAYNAQVDLLTNFMNNGSKVDAFSLLGYLQKMRQITGLAKAAEPSIIEPMRDYLSSEEGDNKIIIGLHHHLVNERLINSLRDFPSVTIRGGMDDFQKEAAKQNFIRMKAPAVCYLSIKAAAEGIDGLQYAAHKAYVFERQWNGADELQFEKRIHRTGQTQKCHIEYTIAAGTVDEYFDEMVEMKRRITTQVEDENYESNPAFMRELAERIVIQGRLR